MFVYAFSFECFERGSNVLHSKTQFLDRVVATPRRVFGNCRTSSGWRFVPDNLVGSQFKEDKLMCVNLSKLATPTEFNGLPSSNCAAEPD